MVEVKKVGIISCSGEECAGGGISRLAARHVLESARPGRTVTICLPLFLAGGEEERYFARTFPTITIDGCDKRCAMRATEKLSGQVTQALTVSELLDSESALAAPFSQRQLNGEREKQIAKVSAALTEAVDEIIGKPAAKDLLTPTTPPAGIRLL
ncbi:DGC domain protein [Acididesulfobacillus acetoxydans]|uniref:DGC domain n=1 Tax=Acididesulfobacillus acetoxydans TaxID=1561005 RepID=A0A8S0VX32_9FIRM|nr:putative zinc-binding protein [Acididesulfobacillus acetoxydans]CAA7601523.1 DGC domain protein [Acididesulfobacillus acetoxydans]CEJ07010.1 DGC domain [Acididesulfobacillus acetoxydans]